MGLKDLIARRLASGSDVVGPAPQYGGTNYVIMTAIDARGHEIIVDFVIDGWPGTYVGARGREHLFGTFDSPQVTLNLWRERMTKWDSDWRQHMTVELGD